MITVLLATVPARRASVSRLLGALAAQARPPDVVHLCVEGYGQIPLPEIPANLCVITHVAERASGPGARWRVLPEIDPSSAFVVLDDDQQIDARDAIARLVADVEAGKTACAQMGTDRRGEGGIHARGRELISMGAAAMAAAASDLAGLDETFEELRAKCGVDLRADGGDDEAAVAAHLWRRGVKMRASGDVGISTASGTQACSQFLRRQVARGHRSIWWQREAIARVTGWPWPLVR